MAATKHTGPNSILIPSKQGQKAPNGAKIINDLQLMPRRSGRLSKSKKYNIRDVETEMSIQARLVKYPVPDSVRGEYHMDQEINDHGVALDMELVRQAIQMDGRSRSELTQAMKELTASEYPNSCSR